MTDARPHFVEYPLRGPALLFWTVVGWAAGSAVIVAPPGSDALAIGTTALYASIAAIVAGTVLVVLGLRLEPAWRGRIRRAWSVIPLPPDRTNMRVTRAFGIRQA